MSAWSSSIDGKCGSTSEHRPLEWPCQRLEGCPPQGKSERWQRDFRKESRCHLLLFVALPFRRGGGGGSHLWGSATGAPSGQWGRRDPPVEARFDDRGVEAA